MFYNRVTLNKIHIFFLIRSLNIGGTECQLVELIKGLDKNAFEIIVGLFYDEGILREELTAMEGVKLLPLYKSGRWDLIRFCTRLITVLSRSKPHILYSFLPDANLVGLISGRIARVKQIVWGVRASNMDVSRYGWLAGISLRLSAFLSRFPDAIIANSFRGIKFHRNIGYNTNRMMIIQNGIDIDRFKPDHSAGLLVRDEWGIDKKTVLIGLVARMDPMKDYPSFLKAAKIFIQRHNDVCFVCVGDGPVDYKEKLYLLSEELGLRDFIIWVGLESDMTAVYNAMDIVTSSSSFGEGFPNVIGEAMACGVPCVVTDIGDSAIIVGETGIVVPPEDPQALADGWRSMLKRLNDKSYSIKEMARARIVSHYSSEIFIQKTSRMFLGLLRYD
jgi:glycosyltransferase involved in cell wall biosynthesis